MSRGREPVSPAAGRVSEGVFPHPRTAGVWPAPPVPSLYEKGFPRLVILLAVTPCDSGPGTVCYRLRILEEKLKRNQPGTGVFEELCRNGGPRALRLLAACTERDIDDTVLCAVASMMQPSVSGATPLVRGPCSASGERRQMRTPGRSQLVSPT